MSLPIQKGFWQENYIGNCRQKLADIYYNTPEACKSEKGCILEYWYIYENLNAILGDKWENFKNWFLGATSPETITRCLRSLKEDKTIQTNEKERLSREDQQDFWQQYWGENG